MAIKRNSEGYPVFSTTVRHGKGEDAPKWIFHVLWKNEEAQKASDYMVGLAFDGWKVGHAIKAAAENDGLLDYSILSAFENDCTQESPGIVTGEGKNPWLPVSEQAARRQARKEAIESAKRLLAAADDLGLSEQEKEILERTVSVGEAIS